MKNVNKQNKSFDNLHKKSLQVKVIDKNEYEALCKFFLKSLGKMRNETFLKKLTKKQK